MWSPLSLSAPPAGLSAGNARLVQVDPWSHGKRRDLTDPDTYLSFPNAVNAVLDELGMSAAPAALGLAVAASNLSELAANLSGLGKAFPLPNLQRLGRRAAALLDLEQSKWDLVEYGAAEVSVNLSSLPSLRAMLRADLLKDAEDAANALLSSDPVNVVADLLSELSSKPSSAAASSAATAALSGSPKGCFRFYAEGNVLNALLDGHPDHDFTLTSIMLFVGKPADLALLKAVLQ